MKTIKGISFYSYYYEISCDKMESLQFLELDRSFIADDCELKIKNNFGTDIKLLNILK